MPLFNHIQILLQRILHIKPNPEIIFLKAMKIILNLIAIHFLQELRYVPAIFLSGFFENSASSFCNSLSIFNDPALSLKK